MLKIAICDDENAICSQVEAIIMDYAADTGAEIEVSVFNSGKRLCASLESEGYFDLIFLDIRMDGYDGIETGKAIRNTFNDYLTHIVFISWVDAYCLQLFEIRPANFLVKPLTQDMIIKEITYVQNSKNKICRSYCFKIGHEIYKIPFTDIISFESRNKKVILTTTKCKYQFYDTIDNITAELKSNLFIRIHKSCMVNDLHVTTFKYDAVVLSDLRVMAISQSRRKAVREAKMSLMEEDIIK